MKKIIIVLDMYSGKSKPNINGAVNDLTNINYQLTAGGNQCGNGKELQENSFVTIENLLPKKLF